MKDHYLQKAEENLPRLFKTRIHPKYENKTLYKGDTVVLDLLNHYVGYFSFNLGYLEVYIDAPVTLRVRFCETEREIHDDFSTYKGRLSASWLQEDTVNVDFPGVFRMPRRYAARYIVINIINSPRPLTLTDFEFEAQTCADTDALPPLNIDDQRLVDIDRVAVNTLKNCMQRIYEDGPKRDRRLWTGDLRLEALANAYTFKSYALTRRCLYLFAASEPNERGMIPGYLYEYPKFVSGSWWIRDYSLLFVATLCDYLEHTGDSETFLDIYPAAKAQMDSADSELDGDGLLMIKTDRDAFIDWCEGLKKVTALNGVYIYVLDLLVQALKKLGHTDAKLFENRLKNARKCAREHLYDAKKNAFVNAKDDYQYSVHSTVFMVLADIIDPSDAKAALLDALNSQSSVKPFTPYAHHYVIEAMFKLGLENEAFEYIKSFWGMMVDLGANTFYEAFVPDDLDFSPYGDRMINSMCHAWSCTPTYFIRKYKG